MIYVGNDQSNLNYNFNIAVANDVTSPIKLYTANNGISLDTMPLPTDLTTWSLVNNQAILDKIKSANELPISSINATSKTAVWFNGLINKDLVLQSATVPAVRDDLLGTSQNTIEYSTGDGKIHFEVEGETQKNEVVNGNFVGTTGWSSTGANLSATSNILTATGTGAGSSIYAYQTTNVDVILNKKLYYKGLVRVTDALCTSIKLILSSTTGADIIIQTINNPVQNQWYTISAVGVNTGTQSGKNRFQLSASYADATTQNSKVMQVQQAMCIDLTTKYGTGLESTVVQCDVIYANWFDGIKSVGEDFSGTGIHKIEVLSRTRNIGLTNTIDWEQGTIASGDGLDYISTENLRTKSNLYYRLKPNTNYIKSIQDVSYFLYILIYDSSKKFISLISSDSFTTPSNAYYFRERIYKAGSNLTSDFVSNIKPQLEEGTTVTPYVPYQEDKINISLTQPLRKISSTVFDKYAEGQVTRNISPSWTTIDGSLAMSHITSYAGFKRCNVVCLPNASYVSTKVIKNNGIELGTDSTLNGDNANASGSDTGLRISVFNIDTGFTDSYTPSQNELKAYFYGWKICHSDGVSPYQVNGINYTPTTWAEWTKTGGMFTSDATGMTIPSLSYAKIPWTAKVSTKYGILLNTIMSSQEAILYIGDQTAGQPFELTYETLSGNSKKVITTNAVITDNKFTLWAEDFDVKVKDIRVFELPTGSDIERDFNTLTADQLAAKYLFYGLNPKNWKKVTDGTGITAMLPTATYTGYTPYKMLYQLAIPTTETVTVNAINGFANGSILTDSGAISAKTNILQYLLPATSTSWQSADKTNVTTLNGTNLSVTSNILGNTPQIKVKFNVVGMLEEKYGTLPCGSDFASKVAWVKANVSSILANGYIFGLGVSGNKAYLKIFKNSDLIWSVASSNNASTPTLNTLNYPNVDINSAILIDNNGFAQYITYTDQANTTSDKILVLNSHGLSVNDIVENTFLNKFALVSSIATNSLEHVAMIGQKSGDIINKYKFASNKLATTGTDATTLKITAHGLSTGDYIRNMSFASAISKVTVIDANTLTLSIPIIGQVSGNTFNLYHLSGTQTAESTVIPSTINMDYISLDVQLKAPSGYDLLVPSNPRRDDGLGNVIMVEKNYASLTKDFTGKVSGSTVENPHIAKFDNTSNMLVPSAFVDPLGLLTTANYNAISALGSSNFASTINSNGYISKQLFSFNLIRMYEDTYGVIPITSTATVDKVNWLKANLATLVCNWTGYGSCPSGNKAYLARWGSSTWEAVLNNTSSTSSELVRGTLPSYIDSNGFVHYLAYTDASDGVTASTIYTDYINLQMTFKNATTNTIEYFTNNSVEIAVNTVNKASAYMTSIDMTAIANALTGGSNVALKALYKATSNVDIYATGVGSNGGVLANGVKYYAWNGSAWVNLGSNVTSVISKINCLINSSNYLQSTNKLYIMVASQFTSDSAINSVVSLDYIDINILLSRAPDVLAYGNGKTYMEQTLNDKWVIVLKGVAFENIKNPKPLIIGSTEIDLTGMVTNKRFQSNNIVIQQNGTNITISVLNNAGAAVQKKIISNTITGLQQIKYLNNDLFIGDFYCANDRNFTDSEIEDILHSKAEGFRNPNISTGYILPNNTYNVVGQAKLYVNDYLTRTVTDTEFTTSNKEIKIELVGNATVIRKD